MTPTSPSPTLHPFPQMVFPEQILHAFERKDGPPFLLRHGKSMDGYPKIRCGVSYARLVEAGRRVPALVPFAEKAKEFLLAALRDTPPQRDSGWSIWGKSADVLLQAY